MDDIPEAEAFYHGVLGFDVMVRTYPGALFVSAGGYHHHIGLNTWHSRGAAPSAPGSVGLRHFEVRHVKLQHRYQVGLGRLVQRGGFSRSLRGRFRKLLDQRKLGRRFARTRGLFVIGHRQIGRRRNRWRRGFDRCGFR